MLIYDWEDEGGTNLCAKNYDGLYGEERVLEIILGTYRSDRMTLGKALSFPLIPPTVQLLDA